MNSAGIPVKNELEQTAGGLSSWQLAFGSIVIGGHLLAVLVMMLAVPSGPWPTADGNGLSTPPQFAYSLSSLIPSSYLQSLGMADRAGHLSGNPAMIGVSIELRLEDADGRPLTTLRLPDPNRNWWVRHRQGLLARALADDLPVAPPEGEMIAGPGQAVPSTAVWELSTNGELELRELPEHLLPRDRPMFRPSEKSLLLVRSMSRHACRAHGAARAEVIRHTQQPIPPAVMFLPNPPPSTAAGSLVSRFGKFGE